MMKNIDLEKLRNSLPHGCRNVIANRLNKSKRLVDFVLAGKRENMEIIRQAIEMAETHKIELENIARKIREL